jgi:hypothetical protein
VDDEYELCLRLEAMGGEHWEALEYVEKYGVEAPQREAFADLEEWEAVVQLSDNTWITTDLGDRLLEEGQP